MSLLPLAGHEAAKKRVSRALQTGRMPQVLLITGPQGVGKQRFALWIGQLALCERPGEGPCGNCQSCRRALALEHPDLHWLVPIERPKAGEQDRQIEEAGDRIAEAVAGRREKGMWGPVDGLASHGVASAHWLLRRAALTPVVGRRKVFVVGEADRLVPQESSPEAANALLKFLEEPPADTVVVLTATEPERVLPTIRSRAVPLRLAPLSDETVGAFARAHLDRKWNDDDISRAAGTIGRLGTESEGSDKAGRAARLVAESLGKGTGARYERALSQPPWSARGGFTDLLDALAAELRDDIRQRAPRGDAAPAVAALARVQAAREQAQGNVNPQLLLAALIEDLAGER
ncbi:MAG TPA: hypothetical protein VFN96_09515 [Gemmatimonadales bacterium]|nr:hypothetical protein [Gemmatimonadales bacterium]